MVKEAELLAQFLGPNKVPIGQFELPKNLIGSSNSFKPLKIRFELRKVALTNLTTFGAALGYCTGD